MPLPTYIKAGLNGPSGYTFPAQSVGGSATASMSCDLAGAGANTYFYHYSSDRKAIILNTFHTWLTDSNVPANNGHGQVMYLARDLYRMPLVVNIHGTSPNNSTSVFYSTITTNDVFVVSPYIPHLLISDPIVQPGTWDNNGLPTVEPYAKASLTVDQWIDLFDNIWFFLTFRYKNGPSSWSHYFANYDIGNGPTLVTLLDDPGVAYPNRPLLPQQFPECAPVQDTSGSLSSSKTAIIHKAGGTNFNGVTILSLFNITNGMSDWYDPGNETTVVAEMSMYSYISPSRLTGIVDIGANAPSVSTNQAKLCAPANYMTPYTSTTASLEWVKNFTYGQFNSDSYPRPRNLDSYNPEQYSYSVQDIGHLNNRATGTVNDSTIEITLGEPQ